MSLAKFTSPALIATLAVAAFLPPHAVTAADEWPDDWKKRQPM